MEGPILKEEEVKKEVVAPINQKAPSANVLKARRLKRLQVIKNRKLNRADFGNFNNKDYQVLLLLMSKLYKWHQYAPSIPSEALQREHTLTAIEFSQTFGIPLNNCYRILKHAVDRLKKSDITIEKLELKEIWSINVCSVAKYNEGDGYISFKFTDDIMPYLAQVSKKFVSYNLKEIANFGSIYTTRLYELVQEFKDTGWMVKTIIQLRKLFGLTEKDYKLYGDFKRRTFGYACREINKYHPNLGLRFEEEKKDGKVIAIKFFFKKNISVQSPPDLKEVTPLNSSRDREILAYLNAHPLIWRNICEKLIEDIGELDFKVWIVKYSLFLVEMPKGNVLKLMASTNFGRYEITQRYSTEIKTATQYFIPIIEHIEIETRSF